MIGNAPTVRETVDERQYTLPKEVGPLSPVALHIRLTIVAIFIVGCLLVFLPSIG
jgi:hypothetical protein